MEKYIFVCIGSSKLSQDSFGPRVGNLLEKEFYKNSNIEVLGTMERPVHFKNAPIFLDYLKKEKNIILIDSAISKQEKIGLTYINVGGVEIGKAFGKSFYFPANINIKTIVGTNKTSENIETINRLAKNTADKIIKTVYQII